jgi:hypothetical protein
MKKKVKPVFLSQKLFNEIYSFAKKEFLGKVSFLPFFISIWQTFKENNEMFSTKNTPFTFL